jgi:hypothetical protein
LLECFIPNKCIIGRFSILSWFHRSEAHIGCGKEGFWGRVPAIVFGYPRHSGATDEEMTNGPPIFAYLVFGLGRVSVKRLLRPIKAAV